MVDSEGAAGFMKVEDDSSFFKNVVFSFQSPQNQAETMDDEKDEKAKKHKKTEKHLKREMKKKEKKRQEIAGKVSGETRDRSQMTESVKKDFTKVKKKKPRLEIEVVKPDDDNNIDYDDDDSGMVSLHSPTESSKPAFPSEGDKQNHLKHKRSDESIKDVNRSVISSKFSGAAQLKVDPQTKSDSVKQIHLTKTVSPIASTSSGNLSTEVASMEDPLLAASISSIEDKRAKLRAKIAELQAKRNPTDRERFDKRKLKRQENKMKLKQKRKLEKSKLKQKEGQSNKGNMNKGAAVTPSKPIYNKEGQMVFSKFDFTDSGKKEKKHSDLHGKDYKRLLEKIERRNEKINQVKSKDEHKAKSLEEKFKWESMLHKAEGEKVKDNPELLKKALKKKEKMKAQKKKKWESRVNQVEKMKDEKQQKRNDNINKRKQANKERKLKKLKKKGRLIPGF